MAGEGRQEGGHAGRAMHDAAQPCCRQQQQRQKPLISMLPSHWRTSNWLEKSRNFWLEMVLIGEVYTARVQCLAASANAYSAATVLPAEVCAATNTDRPCGQRAGRRAGNRRRAVCGHGCRDVARQGAAPPTSGPHSAMAASRAALRLYYEGAGAHAAEKHAARLSSVAEKQAHGRCGHGPLTERPHCWQGLNCWPAWAQPAAGRSHSPCG